MRRAVALSSVVLLAALAAGAAPGATKTRECNGLSVCVPVFGPWVVVPTGAASARPQTVYQLSCPQGFVAGGLDAELSVRTIEVTFDARLGSPVNPGVSTTRDAVFRATKTSSSPRRVSFRPHLGCVPSSGGGGPRPRTEIPRSSAPLQPAAVFAPTQQTIGRARNVPVKTGRRQRIAVACAHGEHLVSASNAIGFYTQAPPPAALLGAVSADLATRASRAIVTARNTLPAGVDAVLQVVAYCTGGGA
jgi:hypothetical protein